MHEAMLLPHLPSFATCTDTPCTLTGRDAPSVPGRASPLEPVVRCSSAIEPTPCSICNPQNTRVLTQRTGTGAGPDARVARAKCQWLGWTGRAAQPLAHHAGETATVIVVPLAPGVPALASCQVHHKSQPRNRSEAGRRARGDDDWDHPSLLAPLGVWCRHRLRRRVRGCFRCGSRRP